MVRLGWVSSVATAEVDWGKANGGVVLVPLYLAEDVALIPLLRLEVDWRAVRRTGPGRRSPLAGGAGRRR